MVTGKRLNARGLHAKSEGDIEPVRKHLYLRLSQQRGRPKQGGGAEMYQEEHTFG